MYRTPFNGVTGNHVLSFKMLEVVNIFFEDIVIKWKAGYFLNYSF